MNFIRKVKRKGRVYLAEVENRLSPRHAGLLDAMSRTPDARHLGMQVRLKLPHVEMTPRPFLGVIKRG